MSKHPSPRLDQLRAMREAKFARSLQSQRAEEKPAAPAKRTPAIVEEPAAIAPAPEAPAQKTATKKQKAAAKPAAKKKAKKKAG
jgi:hypothetical protein